MPHFNLIDYLCDTITNTVLHRYTVHMSGTYESLHLGVWYLGVIKPLGMSSTTGIPLVHDVDYTVQCMYTYAYVIPVGMYTCRMLYSHVPTYVRQKMLLIPVQFAIAVLRTH